MLLAFFVIAITGRALHLQLLFLAAQLLVHTILIQPNLAVAANASALAGLITASLVSLVALRAIDFFPLPWATSHFLDTFTVDALKSFVANTRLVTVILVAFNFTSLVRSTAQGLFATSIQLEESVFANTFSSAARNAVLVAMWTITICADLLGFLVGATALHALGLWHTHIRNSHKIPFAEAPRLASLFASRVIVRAILIAASTTVKELFVHGTLSFAAFRLSDANGTNSHESWFTEASFEALLRL